MASRLHKGRGERRHGRKFRPGIKRTPSTSNGDPVLPATNENRLFMEGQQGWPDSTSISDTLHEPIIASGLNPLYYNNPTDYYGKTLEDSFPYNSTPRQGGVGYRRYVGDGWRGHGQPSQQFINSNWMPPQNLHFTQPYYIENPSQQSAYGSEQNFPRNYLPSYPVAPWLRQNVSQIYSGETFQQQSGLSHNSNYSQHYYSYPSPEMCEHIDHRNVPRRYDGMWAGSPQRHRRRQGNGVQPSTGSFATQRSAYVECQRGVPGPLHLQRQHGQLHGQQHGQYGGLHATT